MYLLLLLLLLLLLCRYTDLPIKETECAFQIKENKVTVAIIFEIFYHNRPSPWTNSIRWHTLDSWKNMLFAHDAYQRRIDVFAVALGTWLWFLWSMSPWPPDRFTPFPRRPLVPICIKIGSLISKISRILATDEQTDIRMDNVRTQGQYGLVGTYW